MATRSSSQEVILDRLGAEAGPFGDPFSIKQPDSFFSWLNAPTTSEKPEPPYLFNLITHVHNYREDVAKGYPRYRNVGS
jgi:hypothetical protein